MRKILILLIFFTFNELISQETENESSECGKGEKQALIDFSNGLYFYHNYIGLTTKEKDYDFEKYYQLYLDNEFGIKTKTTGCSMFMEEICYLNVMDSLLGKKYNIGKSFVKVNKKQQEEKFKKLKNKEKAKVLNEKEFYNQHFLESFPKFKGNKLKLRKYFENYFKMENKAGSFGVKLSISKNGEIIDLNVFWPEILRNRKMNDKKNVIIELNKLGKWKSGKIYNENVNSVFITRI
jgi:hypothetical protein